MIEHWENLGLCVMNFDYIISTVVSADVRLACSTVCLVVSTAGQLTPQLFGSYSVI